MMLVMDFARKIVESFVNGEVYTDQFVRMRSVIVTIVVPPDEVGKVIGKNGSMIEALRTVLEGYARKKGMRRVVIKVEALRGS